MRPRDIVFAILITFDAAVMIWSIVRGDTSGAVAGAALLVGISALAIGSRRSKHN
jgi:hypothetical protein